MRATLTELNSNSNALARAAQAGETVIITDRGTPIVDMVPHHEPVWVAKQQLVEGLRVLRATVHVPQATSDVVRRQMDAVLDPHVDVDAAG